MDKVLRLKKPIRTVLLLFCSNTLTNRHFYGTIYLLASLHIEYSRSLFCLNYMWTTVTPVTPR